MHILMLTALAKGKSVVYGVMYNGFLPLYACSASILIYQLCGGIVTREYPVTTIDALCIVDNETVLVVSFDHLPVISLSFDSTH